MPQDSLRVGCGRLFLIAALVLAGCSRQTKLGIVEGDVLLDGQPLQEGRVQFTPEDGKGQPGGATIADGKFKAEMPPAKMKVAINANKVVGKTKAYPTPESPWIDEVVELIPHRYNATSELSLDVKPGRQSVKYELKGK
jgi:hypothetical protein